jgi:asparagine synthetase B (glutamine-hydrolysing)
MSWLLAVVRKNPSSIQSATLSHLHPTPLHQVISETRYVAAGGIPQTCLHGSFRSAADGRVTWWMVLGLGISCHEDHCTFISPSEWERILAQPEPNLRALDGHFAILRWQEGLMECFTDQLGMRTLYLGKVPEGIAVSTQLDWITQLKGQSEIDFGQFGSPWLTFNQFSHQGLVKEVDRLGPLGYALVKDGNYSITHTDWPLEIRQSSEEELVSKLQSFINPHIDDSRSLTVGLSGGLDSRLLVALLLSAKRPFSSYVFGHADEPDVRIARRIAAAERLTQMHFHDPLPSPDECLAQVRSFVVRSGGNSPVSGYIKQRYYGRIHSEQKVLIDGGMAEIARRQFMNRLLKFGRRAILNRRRPPLLPYVSYHRAPIFNEETMRDMQRGVEEQLNAVLRNTWKRDEASLGNFLDLLVVRYRFPNYAAYGQRFMDGEIVNYMPFAQPSVIRAALAIPEENRKNGKLFRKLIRRCHPSLTRFPLVKGYSTYPFLLQPVPAMVWMKAKSLLRAPFADPGPAEILTVLSDFVQDTAHSSVVRNYAPYDYAAILRMVTEFYQGKKERARELDWWLSFELWRKSLRDEL